MTQVPRVQSTVQRALVTVLLAILSPAGAPEASAFSQKESVNPQAAAVHEFQQRLNDYLELREALSKKLKPLSTTPSAAELTARQQALAAAIRAARKAARPGDLIPAAAAAQITHVCLEDFHFRNPQAKRATLQEVSPAVRPAINRTFPEDAALPTVPPLLLSKLPQLPDNLQYRFFGRHIVILDGDTQIIVDYVPDVLPPR
jgi:hypothetical protein